MLTENEIISTISGIKAGTMFRITYKSELPLKAEFKNQGCRLIKVTTATVRTGVDYDNIGAVIEKKAERNDTSDTSKPRSNNYRWIVPNRVLYNDKTEHYYVRIATFSQGSNKTTRYLYVDNLEETYELESLDESKKNLIQPSYFNKLTPDVQNINFKNIISIGKVSD